MTCHHPHVYEILKTNFNAFIPAKTVSADNIDLLYETAFDDSSKLYSLTIAPQTVLTTPLLGKFLYWIEKEITISLQKIRSDLYFLHAATLEYNGNAFILAGQTGSGKSTMTWALSNNNCGYMSDELAPIDIPSMTIQPFPHAICLKTEPPSPYTYPAQIITTERASHIPTTNRNIKVIMSPLQLKTIFFIQHDTESVTPVYRKLQNAEATLRLYTNALNPLAHENAGLTSATSIVANCACYELMTADLTASCELVKQCLDTQEDNI